MFFSTFTVSHIIVRTTQEEIFGRRPWKQLNRSRTKQRDSRKLENKNILQSMRQLVFSRRMFDDTHGELKSLHLRKTIVVKTCS